MTCFRYRILALNLVLVFLLFAAVGCNKEPAADVPPTAPPEIADSISAPAPAPTAQTAPGEARSEKVPFPACPVFTDADGRVLSLNMSREAFEEAIGITIEDGYLYRFPQLVLNAASDQGKIVSLEVGEGWKNDLGLDTGATVEQITALLGEPDEIAEPANEHTPELNYRRYMSTDGYVVFLHKGDGVVTSVAAVSCDAEGEASGAFALGVRTIFFGSGDYTLPNFSAFGEITVNYRGAGSYRMSVCGEDGTECLLCEGSDDSMTTELQDTVSGSLTVEAAGEWELIIDYRLYR